MRDEDKTKEQLIDELRRLRSLVRADEGQKGGSPGNDVARVTGVWSWDPRSDVVSWSDDQWLLFGLPSHQTRLTLAQALERIHPDDRASLQRVLAQALKDHLPFEFEFRVLDGDGKDLLLCCRGQVTVGPDGEPESAFGSVQAVAGQRRADEALTLSQRRFQAFFENALDAIVLVDDQGHYVD